MTRDEVSRRLKAARWLAGTAAGRSLPVDELAESPLLRENRISANRIEEIEQQKTQARPIELERIAAALGMPRDWFEVDYRAIDRLAAAGGAAVEGEQLEAEGVLARMERKLDEIAARQTQFIARLGELDPALFADGELQELMARAAVRAAEAVALPQREGSAGSGRAPRARRGRPAA